MLNKNIKNYNIKNYDIVRFCVALFFIIFVIAPILSMLGRITPSNFIKLVSSEQFLTALKNSVLTALTATVISVLLALFAALGTERTGIAHKNFFKMLFLMPMLIPSISHAFGLVALFGANGIITKFFNLNVSIYGFYGIIAGSVMYSFPAAFLIISAVLDLEDGTQHNAARILGVPAFYRLTGLTLPFLKRPLISAFFAVFTMIITDYGVPLMIGGKFMTLSVLMYNKAVAMIDYNSGSIIGAFLLIPAIIAFIVDVLNSESGQNAFITEKVSVTGENKVLNIISYLFCITMSIFILAPIIAFCFMIFETKYPVNPTFTLYHIVKTINRGAGAYLLNSIIYAFSAAISGTVLAFACAYMTSRMSGRFNKLVHLMSLTSMAIPGIVLGLSYLIFFNKSMIYGTVFIIVLVNTIHFFASPYLMMYNALIKINPNLEDVGLTLGVKRFAIIFDVIIPKVKANLFEMFSYFFVNSMMTISAVSFLAPPAPKPVALMINQFEAQLLMESAAFVSVLILIVNLILKFIISKLNKN